MTADAHYCKEDPSRFPSRVFLHRSRCRDHCDRAKGLFQHTEDFLGNLVLRSIQIEFLECNNVNFVRVQAIAKFAKSGHVVGERQGVNIIGPDPEAIRWEYVEVVTTGLVGRRSNPCLVKVGSTTSRWQGIIRVFIGSRNGNVDRYIPGMVGRGKSGRGSREFKGRWKVGGGRGGRGRGGGGSRGVVVVETNYDLPGRPAPGPVYWTHR
jgi:hypothetical protein